MELERQTLFWGSLSFCFWYFLLVGCLGILKDKKEKNKKKTEQIFEKRLAFWNGMVYDNVRTNVLFRVQLFGYAA